jgi:hypothetical protein
MPKKRETYIKPIKYPPSATITTSRQLIEQLAQDLIEGHNAEAYNLEYWPAAREFVTRFHTGEIKAKRRRA